MQRQCLCRRRPRAVLAAGDECGKFDSATLRRARQSLARRDDRRRARRCRAVQARRDGLRAVEAVEAGRTVLAVAVRASGPGRPGWHIECSAMAWKHLGEQFDIHGGGIDLVFPHHENELAQTRCAFHTDRMANVWMHNGFLQVEGEKMSKSLGNFVTIRDLLNSWTGAVVRYSMLQTHYRQPIDWTVSRLEQSRQEMGNWAAMYSGSEAHADYQQRKFRKEPPKPTQELVDALGDDLNTSLAVAVLRKQFSEKSITEGLTADFFQNCEFLGLLNGENIGTLEDTHVLGTNVQPRRLFDAIPFVMKYRVGVANSIPEVIQRADPIWQLSVSCQQLDVTVSSTLLLWMNLPNWIPLLLAR